MFTALSRKGTRAAHLKTIPTDSFKAKLFNKVVLLVWILVDHLGTWDIENVIPLDLGEW
jgi:hypothetical protein